MSSRGGSSQGGSSRADRGKAPIVEPEGPVYRPLNEFQDDHRTVCFSQPDNTKAKAKGGFRYRQHHINVLYIKLFLYIYLFNYVKIMYLYVSFPQVPWNVQFEPYFASACLLQTQRIGYIPIDGILITALQERWRKETHTFHMPHGEMTITLEDVSCLLGLRVDGKPLCVKNSGINWANKAGELLGKTPPQEMFRGSGNKKSNVLVKKKWFMENFADLECDAPILRVEQYCRAYMIGFFSDILFTDPNGDCYSLMPLVLLEEMNNLHEWAFGSGVLAYLYRELCKSTGPDRKNMGGCILLLQLWAWQHFATGRPRVSLNPARLNIYDDPDYNDTVGMLWRDARVKEDPSTTHLWANRDMLDSIPQSDIFWAPYEPYRDRLPPICQEERTTALLSVPLIYFWIVERYRPERVMRQFGYRQKIPPEIPEADKIADKELRDLTNFRGNDWRKIHKNWITRWNDKWYWYSQMDPLEPYTPLDYDGYMSWYWQNSDPLVQSTISHGSSTYRPMVPEKRLAVNFFNIFKVKFRIINFLFFLIF